MRWQTREHRVGETLGHEHDRHARRSDQIVDCIGRGVGRQPIDIVAIGGIKSMRQSQFFDALMGLLLHEVPDRPAAPGKPSMDPGMAARHPLRILLAEDNVVNQKLALRLLQQLGDREMCLAAGMDDYVTKPIRVDQLVEALNHVAPQKDS